MKNYIFFFILFGFIGNIYAQYPTYSQLERDKLQNVTAGTVILNTNTNCLNYYSNHQWWELCGQCPVIPPTIDSIVIKDNHASIFLTHPENQVYFSVTTKPNKYTITDSARRITLRNLDYETSYTLEFQTEKTCGKSPIITRTIICKKVDACQGNTTLTDIRNNKTYPIQSIAGTCWMQEDLNYEDKSGRISDKEIVKTTRPYRYTWKYANQQKQVPSFQSQYNHFQGICPEGWHLPSYAEAWDLYLYQNQMEIQPLKVLIGEVYDFETGQINPSEYNFYWIGSVAQSGFPAFFIANHQFIRVFESEKNFGAAVRCVKD